MHCYWALVSSQGLRILSFDFLYCWQFLVLKTFCDGLESCGIVIKIVCRSFLNFAVLKSMFNVPTAFAMELYTPTSSSTQRLLPNAPLSNRLLLRCIKLPWTFFAKRKSSASCQTLSCNQLFSFVNRACSRLNYLPFAELVVQNTVFSLCAILPKSQCTKRCTPSTARKLLFAMVQTVRKIHSKRTSPLRKLHKTVQALSKLSKVQGTFFWRTQLFLLQATKFQE